MPCARLRESLVVQACVEEIWEHPTGLHLNDQLKLGRAFELITKECLDEYISMLDAVESEARR
jgi:hypothetical protein